MGGRIQNERNKFHLKASATNSQIEIVGFHAIAKVSSLFTKTTIVMHLAGGILLLLLAVEAILLTSTSSSSLSRSAKNLHDQQ